MCFHTCTTSSRSRRSGANLCRTKSDSIGYVNVHGKGCGGKRGWESDAVGNERERWTREMGDGNAWAIFCLAILYHDYISRLIRSLCGPTIAPPPHHGRPPFVKDQEVQSLLPRASRRYQCRMEQVTKQRVHVPWFTNALKWLIREKRNRWWTI